MNEKKFNEQLVKQFENYARIVISHYSYRNKNKKENQ